MQRVNESKEPNPRQMLNMAENLQELFNKPAEIRVSAWMFSSNNKETIYHIYIADHILMEFKTWKETFDYYKKLLKKKGEKNEITSKNR